MKWLWRAWKGNRLQATLNALIGVMLVVISLAQVWAARITAGTFGFVWHACLLHRITSGSVSHSWTNSGHSSKKRFRPCS